MAINEIMELKPEDILRKEAFRRAKPSSRNSIGSDSPDYNMNLFREPMRYKYITQADFLREFDPASHKINSLRHYPNQMQNASSNKIRIKIKTRVAIAWQQRILTKRLAALTGNDCEITLASSQTGKEYQETLALFKEGWSIKNMENAIYRAIKADGITGDTAICFYKDDNREFGWRIFSYEQGDILYPHYDPMTGTMDAFGRLYAESAEDGKEIQYLDIYTGKQYMRYRKDAIAGKNEDWKIDVYPKPHNFPFLPIAYHRYGEPFWANSQSLIEQHELAMSQLAENNAQYALRILYSLGAEMSMESSLDGTPTQITSPDSTAKVGFLEPADSSKSYELQLTTLEKNIMRCSSCNETPELKSGSDISSLTVKMLHADGFQKALDDAKEYQPFLDTIVRIFKEGYGTEIGKTSAMTSLKVQIRLVPWVFMSDQEIVSNLVQLTSLNILSRRSASETAYEILGYGTIDEAERVLQQEHDALIGEAQAEAETNVINNFRNSQ